MHRPAPSLAAVIALPAFLAWLAGGPASHAAPLDLTGPDEARRWSATHDVGSVSPHRDGLEVRITGADPFITSPPLGAGWDHGVVLGFRIWSSSGGMGQVFWPADHAREEDSLHFVARSNAWTEVRLALPPLKATTRLRVDPPGTNGLCRLADMRLADPGSEGVTRVEVSGGSVSVALSGLTGPFDLVELRPEQDEADFEAAPVVHRGSGSGVVALERFPSEGAVLRDRIVAGYCAVVPDGRGGRRPLGTTRRAEAFQGAARRHPPVVQAASRKGLQVQMVDDAIALGVRHAALNVNLTSLPDLHPGADSYEWRSQGRLFHFRKSAVDAIPVKPLSDAGAVVTLILLAYESGDPERDAVALHPGYSRRAPNHLGAFNTVTREGAAWFEATVGFLADRFSDPSARHGRASYFIVGNEVTAHWYWANEGEVPADVFIADYERTVRLANAAASSSSDSIRVFLSFDHHWNLVYGDNPNRAIAGRRLLDGFNRVARMRGDFDWHLAYHPYPENLFNPRTWLDKTATSDPGTPRITFRNLEVLTGYLRRPEFLRDGKARRVILSEQGFHSDGTPEGERLQAAAYAYAWKKVEALEGIDAFILHRHVDHGQEGGLNLGLWRHKPGTVSEPDTRKPIYEVFRWADTDRCEDVFRFALPVVGLTNWEQLRAIPGKDPSPSAHSP